LSAKTEDPVIDLTSAVAFVVYGAVAE
jgi:hypothetical protein